VHRKVAFMKNLSIFSNYADPFTGSGRYIPGATTNASLATGNSDPFTGGSSYTTQQANGQSAIRTNTPALDPFTGSNSYTTFTKPPTGLHFPHRNYTTVDNFDAVKVLDKLR
jgi:phospholipase A-2-activating protein